MPKAVFLRVAPYKDDALNLPVESVELAIPFYEEKLAFRVVERKEAPTKTAILARDGIQIGLAENGGDPSQEGCFFAVNDIEAAYEDFHGAPPSDSAIKVQRFGDTSSRVFFIVAPDGLCYMLGETTASEMRDWGD